MNISLGNTAKKKAKKQYGLQPKKTKNVLGDESSSEEEDQVAPSNGDHRAQVNRQLQQEQSALRKRAAAAMYDYDFDGQYETQETEQQETQERNSSPKEKKSRYIQDLLQAAQQRKLQREDVYERKLAQEQAEEDALLENQGKEKFVTKAYRKRLQERQQWKAAQDEQEQQEQTSNSRNMGVAGFYGNLSRNVAMGGAKEQESNKKKTDPNPLQDDDGDDDDFNPYAGGDPTSGFTKAAPNEENSKEPPSSFLDGFAPSKSESEPKEPQQEAKSSMRHIRMEKVAAARERYLQRKQQQQQNLKQ